MNAILIYLLYFCHASYGILSEQYVYAMYIICIILKLLIGDYIIRAYIGGFALHAGGRGLIPGRNRPELVTQKVTASLQNTRQQV